MSDKRIKRERIMLPVDSNGQPHWKYMDEYINNLEIEKTKKWFEKYNHRTRGLTDTQ